MIHCHSTVTVQKKLHFEEITLHAKNGIFNNTAQMSYKFTQKYDVDETATINLSLIYITFFNVTRERNCNYLNGTYASRGAFQDK